MAKRIRVKNKNPRLFANRLQDEMDLRAGRSGIERFPKVFKNLDMSNSEKLRLLRALQALSRNDETQY